MAFTRFKVLIVGGALLLPACSFTEEALWPSLTGEDPAGEASQTSGTGSTAEAVMAAGQPPLGTTNFEPAGVTPGAPTGTLVGQKVNDLREDLRKLQASISNHNGQLQQVRSKTVQDSQRYHGTVAAINARLQVGTTRGNPILIEQFNNAQVDLDRIAIDVSEMNKLAQAVGGDSTMAAYLSERAQATFSISGAIDEDHRQLAILEDETNRTVVLIDRLLKEVTDDVRRQTNYVSAEKGNLNLLASAIKTGEIMGASLPNRAGFSASSGPSDPLVAMDPAGRRPLVVIRFDRQDPPYQQALYNAVSRVLEQRPDALFDLVAVAPTTGGEPRQALNTTKARRHAEGVLRSLMEMGLPPNRVATSAKVMAEARSSEVHLYLR